MRKSIKLLTALSLALLLPSFSLAQIDNVGTSAANFLKIGIGARAQSMGGSYVALADEVSALYWNPAGIAKIKGRQVSFTQIDWITDVNLSFLGGVFSMGDAGSMGVSITYLSMGEMKVTNWANPEGTGETFEANDVAIGLAYARRISDMFTVGIQAKFIQEKISQCTANAFAIDIGVQYNTGFEGLRLGMVLTNFGTEMQLSGRDLSIRSDPFNTVGSNPDDVHANLETVGWSLPVSIRLGASMDIIKNNAIRVTGNLDFYDPRDVDQTWCAGAEVALLGEIVFLRGGVNNYYESELKPSFGGGIKYSFDDTYGIIIDYAYSDLGRLENANRFSLSLTF
jgi:long-subunit fatty acid transport protein